MSVLLYNLVVLVCLCKVCEFTICVCALYECPVGVCGMFVRGVIERFVFRCG